VNAGKAAYVALNFINGIGPKTLDALLKRFGRPETVIAAPMEALCAIPRLTPAIAEAIHRVDLDAVAAELSALELLSVSVHTREEEAYPFNLRGITDAPHILFQKGSAFVGDAKAIAIVGARTPSDAGARIARQLAFGLARRGFTVVSGLAAGIDTAAHRGALEANGRTFAVLASGIQAIHPRQNQTLAEEISRSGAVFSEFKPHAPTSIGAMMRRNRIVAGLALGTIVVEAGDPSGSMDAAKQVRRQNRALFAIDSPGPGNQKLIAEGAIAIPPAATEAALDRIAETAIRQASSVGES
jgi:DNA processing protein